MFKFKSFSVSETMEIVLVSIILGATILLFFYISKIFNNSKGSPETSVILEDQEDESVNKTAKNEPAGNNKTKKKIVDKKQKDKGFTFQHPWLVSTLKGHSGRVLGGVLSLKNTTTIRSLGLQTWISVQMESI